MHRLRVLLCLFLWFAAVRSELAQQSAPFSLQSLGLHSVNHQGAFRAASYLPDGTAVLLSDQGDGLRLLKVDSALTRRLAAVHLGAAGDAGVALTTDSHGNLYVGGTSSSGSLQGTPGTLYPNAADTSLNSFVAKFDSNLNLVFLSFLGADRTVLSGVAASGDAVFIIGSTYSTSFPVTHGALQTTPAPATSGSGFVMSLSADGTSVRYATYLGGPDGTTTPTGVAADGSDDAYVVGSTSSPTFPVVAAVQPNFLGGVSGFIARLSPVGDSLQFSTFVPGSGLTSVALDMSTETILATGSLDPSRFPVSAVNDPLSHLQEQYLIRLSEDGQSLRDATALFPGISSSVTPAPDGTAWVSGALTFPESELQSHAGSGDTYTVHLGTADTIKTALRLGGLSTNNFGYASLAANTAAPAIDSTGTSVLVPVTLTAVTDPSLVSKQTFDLGLFAPAGGVFAGDGSTLLPTACTAGLPCTGSAGLIASLTSSSTPAVTISTAAMPSLLLRNAGLNAAKDFQITASGFKSATNCPASLAPGETCGALLTGSGPGTVIVAASGSAQTYQIATLPPTTQALTTNASTLDFGIVTADAPGTRTITVTNLGASPQIFASAVEGLPSGQHVAVTESASTCAGPAAAHVLAANSSCDLTVRFAASSASDDDGLVKAAWKVGPWDLPITAYSQATALSVSSTTIDFGKVTAASSRLPLFLYLSNASPTPVTHSTLRLADDALFRINDDCPSTLEPRSVCQIGLEYLRNDGPALDNVVLQLEQGLTVLVTGELTTLSPSTTAGPSSLTVSPQAVQFAEAVQVTKLSTETQVVELKNPTSTPVPLQLRVLGDFVLQGGCPTTLLPDATCDVGLKFAPSAAGTRQGSLEISTGDAYTALAVPLTATGTSLLSAMPQTIDLGDRPIGEPSVVWIQIQSSLPQLSVSVSGTKFGVALLNDSGTGHGTLAESAFSTAAQAACSQCWLAIQFLPQAVGRAEGELVLTSDAQGGPLRVPLAGFGLPAAGLLLTPAMSDLGSVPVGSQSSPLTLTLVNALQATTSATLQNVTVTGDFALIDSATGFACKTALAPTAACSLPIVFRPTEIGSRSGTITVTTDAGTATATLTGTGAASSALDIAPVALTFASPEAQQITLTNETAGVLRIGTVSSDSPVFTPSSTCTTLQAGEHCTVSVTYTRGTSPSQASLTIRVSGNDATAQADEQQYVVPLSASPVISDLAVFPTAADFGPGQTGALGQVRQFTLKNTANHAVLVDLVASRNFPLAAPAACSSLQAGASCTFSVIFLPQSGGILSGSVIATATSPDDGSVLSQTLLSLQGYGTSLGGLALSAGTDPAAPLRFGQVESGATSSQSVLIHNTSSVPAAVRRLVSTTPFQTRSDCGQVLAPDQLCTVTLTYAPQYVVSSTSASPPRQDAGTLLIEADANATPTTVYLGGTVLPTITATGNTATLPTIRLSTTALTFPGTSPGSRSASQSIELTNYGTEPVVIADTVASADFLASSTCTTVQPGESCSVSVVFTPASGPQTPVRQGVLAIRSNASTALESVTLLASATTTPVLANPEILTFPPTLIHTSSQGSFTLTNQTTLPVSFWAAEVTGDFAAAGGTCPSPGGSLGPGQSCVFNLAFTPATEGDHTGSLSLTLAGATQPLVLALEGTGTAGHLRADPANLDFGTMRLGSAASRSLAITDVGTAAITGLHYTLTGLGSASFTVQTSCPDATLAVGAACTLAVTFTPSQTGSAAATLVIASSDPASPLLVSLSGVGTPAPGFTLTVNGHDSASASVVRGSTAIFPLAVSAKGGYTDPVKLTCAPVRPAPDATCSLSASSLDMTTGLASASVTITTQSRVTGAAALPWLLLLFTPCGIAGIAQRRRPTRLLSVLALGATVSFGLGGCSGGYAAPPQAVDAPPGTYTYRVTATSATNPEIRSSVVLSVTVQ